MDRVRIRGPEDGTFFEIANVSTNCLFSPSMSSKVFFISMWREDSDPPFHVGIRFNAEGYLGSFYLDIAIRRDCHGYKKPAGKCHGYVQGTGTGTDFCTLQKPVPVAWVRRV